MARLKLDPETIGFSNLMEQMTHARVKDCFKDEETIYFVVGFGQMGKALGKGAINIKRLQEKFNKKIKIIEFNDDVCKFVRNVAYPLKIESVTLEENYVKIQDSSKKTKSLLIGRQSRNLNMLKRAVTRFFNIDIKIE
ncbi:NusA-like transcription termination signal-binding factor [Candidatus Woesearchaeota archaeon]|jgi:transcription termination/antitermination protein NusA|nr:NusA-like transcription termination signal-binding factor [Candidatus Woesearchaeota archaeon]MBT4150390.1 NusA-like transcription termination signal-binding factor [Candidatus Woesearchaeota archaeon]MBT4247390.1 NusA-like transcription termination signal-binding factor [Candidatus Woesearchaeota archaeon]MBT4434555.1 NusA-like transcription termination signal-binding factor [Candidatus Woesearchaeota archaeon]MBT7331996.1 NusA-like transcription termination signal-binding factor [Candidatu